MDTRVSGGSCVVPRAGELCRKICVTPVEHRAGEGDRLHCDSLPVHVRDASFEIDELDGQGAVAAGRGLDEEALVGHVIFGAESRAFFLDEVEERLGKIVRVDIDDLDARRRRGARRRALGEGDKLTPHRGDGGSGQSAFEQLPA